MVSPKASALKIRHYCLINPLAVAMLALITAPRLLATLRDF